MSSSQARRGSAAAADIGCAARRFSVRRCQLFGSRRDNGTRRRREGEDVFYRVSPKEYDETRYARMVAERYGTDHEELVVEPDAIAVLPQLIWHYGEPFADPSAIPTYYVSEMARRKVTVALNGDGGDECFLGYNRYKAMHHLSQLDGMPRWSRVGLGQSLALAPPALQRRFKLPQIRALLQAPDQRPSRRYASTIVLFTDDDKAAGYGDAMQEHLAGAALNLIEPYFAEADSLISGANWADIHTYLPDDLMVKVDVASMAHGLKISAHRFSTTYLWSGRRNYPSNSSSRATRPRRCSNPQWNPICRMNCYTGPKWGSAVLSITGSAASSRN